MREIKFRAWSDGRMIHEGMTEYLSGYGCMFHQFTKPDDALMQFTGLQDQAGVDIYEHDIVYLAGYGECVMEWPFIELWEAVPDGDIGLILGNVHEVDNTPKHVDSPDLN